MAGRVRVNIKVTHTPIARYEADIAALTQQALVLVGEQLLSRIAEVAGVQRYTLRDLAKQGHPFSRWRGGGGYNRGLISKQSGEFFESFVTPPPTYRNGITRLDLINRSPKAEWLRMGTRVAVDRPYMREISKGLEKKFIENLLNALNPKYNVKLRGL
jgi:hypothetical protein